MPNVDLLRMTISELAPKIRNQEISPVELTEAALAEEISALSTNRTMICV